MLLNVIKNKLVLENSATEAYRWCYSFRIMEEIALRLDRSNLSTKGCLARNDTRGGTRGASVTF